MALTDSTERPALTAERPALAAESPALADGSVSLFSDMYDSALFGRNAQKYILSQPDLLNEANAPVLSLRPDLVVQDEWMDQNLVFTKERLLCAVVMTLNGMHANKCSQGFLLLFGKQTSSGHTLMLVHTSERLVGAETSPDFNTSFFCVGNGVMFNENVEDCTKDVFSPGVQEVIDRSCFYDARFHSFSCVYPLGTIATQPDDQDLTETFTSCLSFTRSLQEQHSLMMCSAFVTNLYLYAHALPVSCTKVTLAEVQVCSNVALCEFVPGDQERRVILGNDLQALVSVVSSSASSTTLLRLIKADKSVGPVVFKLYSDGFNEQAKLEVKQMLRLRRAKGPVDGGNKDKQFLLRDGEHVLHCTDELSLYKDVTKQLLLLAQAPDATIWLQSLRHDMNPFVKAVVARRARDIVHRTITAQDLLNRLSDGPLSLRECDGFIFDILLKERGCSISSSISTLPPEWNPRKFYLTGDVGFLNMLYLLQWRSTLQRFIQLAIIADMDGTSVMLSTLINTFRVGILIESAGAVSGQNAVTGQNAVFSDIRVVGDHHLFLFNPSRSTMVLKPYTKTGEEVMTSDWVVSASLQTQCAKQRDSVIAFFIAQAVSLVTRLLCENRKLAASDVSSVLIGMYLASLHDVDLKHSYKHWQRVVRELRQSIPNKKRRLLHFSFPEPVSDPVCDPVRDEEEEDEGTEGVEGVKDVKDTVIAAVEEKAKDSVTAPKQRQRKSRSSSSSSSSSNSRGRGRSGDGGGSSSTTGRSRNRAGGAGASRNGDKKTQGRSAKKARSVKTITGTASASTPPDDNDTGLRLLAEQSVQQSAQQAGDDHSAERFHAEQVYAERVQVQQSAEKEKDYVFEHDQNGQNGQNELMDSAYFDRLMTSMNYVDMFLNGQDVSAVSGASTTESPNVFF